MSVQAICQKDVVTVERHSPLIEVSQQMQKHHVGSVVVTENFEGKKIPCGIITDRDIALALGSSGKPQDLPVEQIMQSHPITVSKSEGLFQTIKKMRDYGIKRLPVVEDDGSLFGVISADDLLTLMAEEIGHLAKICEAQVSNEKGVRLPAEKQVRLA